MKVGDKVFVEVEVSSVGSFSFTDKYHATYNKSEAITKLPIQEGRWMMVSDDENNWKKRFVIGNFKGCFIAIINATNENDLHLEDGCTTVWKYAKEIPTKRKLTMQEIADKFGIDKDNIEICTE